MPTICLHGGFKRIHTTLLSLLREFLEMSGFQITTVIAIVAVAAFFALWRTNTPASTIDPDTLQIGPIRHAQLSDDLVERVSAFESVFAEVYPCTHEEWMEGFQRDLHPENEIVIWEHIAAVFTQFIAGRDLPLATRKEAFGVLLVRSGTDDEIHYSALKHLTVDEAKKLVRLYSVPPNPIQFEQR